MAFEGYFGLFTSGGQIHGRKIDHGRIVARRIERRRLKDLRNEVSFSYRESYNHMVQVAFAFLSGINAEDSLKYYQPRPPERPSRVPMRPTNVTRGHSQDQPRAFGILERAKHPLGP